MINFKKIICALMAMLLCLLAVGCADKENTPVDADEGKIMSNDDLVKLVDDTPDELFKGQKIEGFGT